MRKANIFIESSKGITEVSGYMFTAYNGMEMHVRKSRKWVVSDPLTGRALCYGNTRTDAVGRANKFYADKLKDARKMDWYRDLIVDFKRRCNKI